MAAEIFHIGISPVVFRALHKFFRSATIASLFFFAVWEAAAQPAPELERISQLNSLKQPAVEESFAEIRVRIIDSAALQLLNSKSAAYEKTKVALDVAKAAGAIEKIQLFKSSIDNSLIVAWEPLKSTPLSTVYSRERWSLAESYAGSSGPRKIEPPSNLIFPELSRADFNKAKPQRELITSIPGLTKTLPPTSIGRIAGGISQFKLLEKDSKAESDLIRLINAKDGIIKPTGDATVLVPTSPITATGPIATNTIRVPCSRINDISTLLSQPGADVISGSCGDKFSMQISTDVAADRKSGLDALPSADFMSRMKAILNTTPPDGTKTPILVIVDDGFPSQEAYLETKAFIQEADSKLFKAHGIDAKWEAIPTHDISGRGITAELADFPKTTEGPRGRENCELLSSVKCNFHAKAIEESLRIFTKLVPGAQPVRVVWIPLFYSQPGSAHLAYRISRFANIVPNEYSAESKPYSNEGLENMQKYYFDLIRDRGVGYPLLSADWRVSKPYFSNILSYLRAYSRVEKVPVFVNLSWRTQTEQASGLSSNGTGAKVILVAAAGNPCTEENKCKGATVYEPIGLYEFLRHATFHSQTTYVVANVDAKGQPTCATAHLLNNASSIAFPGGIGSDCGTSFSAPRVAWMLAANERYTTDNSIMQTEPDYWSGKLRERISLKRDATLCVEPHTMACLMPNLEIYFPGLGRGATSR